MTGKPVKILIVDDNQDLALTISDYFEKYDPDINPLITSDSTTVMSIMADNPDIRLILSDFYMPGMSGLDLLMTVREKYPNVLFVMMTGYHTVDIQDKGLELGAVRFFKKPFNITELTDFIHQALADTITGFDGTIDSIQLPDIIQLIAMGNRDAELDLKTPQAVGMIHFRKGEIIHAECFDLKGEDAFFEMFNWRGGQFNVKPVTTGVMTTISQSWQALLLEAAQHQDEAEAVAKGELIVETDQKTGYVPRTGLQDEKVTTDVANLYGDFVSETEPEAAEGSPERGITQSEPELDRLDLPPDLQTVLDENAGFSPEPVELETGAVVADVDETVEKVTVDDTFSAVEESITPAHELEQKEDVDNLARQAKLETNQTAFVQVESESSQSDEYRLGGYEYQDGLTEAERESTKPVLDEKLISEALESAVQFYLKLWLEDKTNILTGELPLDKLPANIRRHYQFRFQRMLMEALRVDDLPFNFCHERVTASVQTMLSALYDTWEVSRATYEEILRYAMSFELAHAINPARALTEIIHEITAGVASEIKSLVRDLIDFGIIGGHFKSLIEDISQQGSRAINTRSIEYLCRSAIYRLDEDSRYECVRRAMRCIVEIAHTDGFTETEGLHYNLVLNMLEAHGLAQVSDYINMTRELNDPGMTSADLDNSIEKFKQRSSRI